MRKVLLGIWMLGLLALLVCAERPRSARCDDGVPTLAAPSSRRPIVIGLPVPQANESGELTVNPNVDLNGQIPPPASPPNSTDAPSPARSPTAPAVGSLLNPKPSGVVPAGATMRTAQAPPAGELLDTPPGAMPGDLLGPPAESIPHGGSNTGVGGYGPIAEPLFGQSLCSDCGGGLGGGGPGGSAVLPTPHHNSTFYGLGGVEVGSCEPGIGHERVMFAPFVIDTSQPESDLRFRFDSMYKLIDPDRTEYYWARIGTRGPLLPEKSVDMQDVRIAWQVATGKAFSITTEVPLVGVSPEDNPDTAGLGDVSVTTKTVLLDGNNWEITQIFRTDTPTGNPHRGLGTGHVSLEPGFLLRYKWTNETYFHSELEYWFPLGGDPTADGTVLKYGFGISHLMYESDTYAIIPTLEFVGWTIFDGIQTSPTGVPQVIDTMGIFNVQPGIRFVRDTGGDLGLFEWGVSGGFPITTNRWYSGSLLLEARFVF